MENLEGRQFGKWTVHEYLGNKMWRCTCSCGTEKAMRSWDIRNETSMQCNRCKGGKNTDSLKDQVFGKWTVIEDNGDKKVKCRCECGTIKDIARYELKRGRTKSCGQCRQNKLKNTTIGEWTLKEYLGNGMWKCECSCGKIAEVRQDGLLSGRSKSCGHSTTGFIDLSGRRFGKLKVDSYAGDHRWNCTCDCENKYVALSGRLRDGSTLMCRSCQMREASKLARETLIKKYGDYSYKNFDSPRSEEQLTAIESKENLITFIERYNLDGKSTSRIAKVVGLTPSIFLQYVHKYGIEDYVDIASSVSVYENEIAEFIEKECDCMVEHSNSGIIPPQEIDIYIPARNTGIEFNGNYWHSDELKNSKYHQDKTLNCLRAGVKLIHIFEYEWVCKQDKIKQYLKSMLSDNKTILYGRNIDVIEVDSDKAAEFVNKHHLNGYVRSEVNIAATYNNEIIGIMSFGSPRFNNNFQWELIRFVWKSGLAVVGGAEKLFKRFVDRYKPENIICYSDISKFRGNVYTRLGFTTNVHEITAPNYVWVDIRTNEVLTRYRTQKKKLVDRGLYKFGDTEDEIMKNIGYVKIYDCGNLRLTWERSR